LAGLSDEIGCQEVHRAEEERPAELGERGAFIPRPAADDPDHHAGTEEGTVRKHRPTHRSETSRRVRSDRSAQHPREQSEYGEKVRDAEAKWDRRVARDVLEEMRLSSDGIESGDPPLLEQQRRREKRVQTASWPNEERDAGKRAREWHDHEAGATRDEDRGRVETCECDRRAGGGPPERDGAAREIVTRRPRPGGVADPTAHARSS